MKTVINLRNWRKLNHNKDQLELFNNIEFEDIAGHSNLVVGDLSEEELSMLLLMGCEIDHSVATDLNFENKSRILFHTDSGYNIVEVNYGKMEFSKK